MSIKKKYIVMALAFVFCTVAPCYNALALAFPNNDCVSYTEYDFVLYTIGSTTSVRGKEFVSDAPCLPVMISEVNSQGQNVVTLYFISNVPFIIEYWSSAVNSSGSISHMNSSSSTINGHTYYLCTSRYAVYNADLMDDYEKYLIFSDLQTAARYIEFGPNALTQEDLDNMFNVPTPEAVYGDLFTLNNFKADFIKSNSSSQERVSFSYSIPSDLQKYINDGHDVKLHISWRYTFSADGFYTDILKKLGYDSDFVVYGQQVRSLLFNGKPAQNFYIMDDMLYSHSWLDEVSGSSDFWFKAINAKPLGILSNLNYNGLGTDSIIGTDISKLDIDFELVEMNGNQYGSIYKTSYNLASGSNYSYVSTPDSSGTYTDSIPQSNGYLDINETQSENGVPTYTQTYHPTDAPAYQTNGSTNSDGVYVPVDVNIGGSNVNFPSTITIVDGDPTVTIEDDDLNHQGIIEAIKDGYGLLDDADTGEKGDGIIAMIGHVFDQIDPTLLIMLRYGLATTITIAVVRALLKR